MAPSPDYQSPLGRRFGAVVAALASAAVIALTACTEKPDKTAATPAPEPDAATIEEELILDSEPGDLYGAFLRPAGPGPFATVIIHPGSGPTDRDGNLPGAVNNSLKMLAEGLAAKGIASLRIDKRGVGRSVAAMTAESDLRFETYVDDLAAWRALVDARPDTADVLLLGHSDGGVVSILAAERSTPARLILLSTPGRPAPDLLREQLQGQLPPDLAARSNAILDALSAGTTVDDAPRELYALYRPSVQPYLISWFRYDPAAELAKVEAPVLIIHGANDIQIPAGDGERLASAREDPRRVVVDGMNHVLKDAPAERMANLAVYNEPDAPLAQGLVETIASFVGER